MKSETGFGGIREISYAGSIALEMTSLQGNLIGWALVKKDHLNGCFDIADFERGIVLAGSPIERIGVRSIWNRLTFADVLPLPIRDPIFVDEDPVGAAIDRPGIDFRQAFFEGAHHCGIILVACEV